MRRLLILLLAAVLLLAGCNQAEVFDKFLPKADVSLAKEFVAKVADKDYVALEAAFVSEAKTEGLRSQLDTMTQSLPAGPLRSVKVIGASITKNPGTTISNITLEYEYPGRWLWATVSLERQADQVRLRGITFEPQETSAEAVNSFTFKGKGLLHYVVFVLAVGIPVLVLYALVVCIRTPLAKRKWLWILFILVSWVQFQFNWSSAEWGIRPVSVMLIGAGFFKSGPYAPWNFELAFPLGAILFLIRRPALTRREEPAASGAAELLPDSTEPGVTGPAGLLVGTASRYR